MSFRTIKALQSNHPAHRTRLHQKDDNINELVIGNRSLHSKCFVTDERNCDVHFLLKRSNCYHNSLTYCLQVTAVSLVKLKRDKSKAE